MTNDQRQAVARDIVAECGDNLTMFAAAQIAWSRGLTITGEDGVSFDALEAALNEAVEQQQKARAA